MSNWQHTLVPSLRVFYNVPPTSIQNPDLRMHVADPAPKSLTVLSSAYLVALTCPFSNMKTVIEGKVVNVKDLSETLTLFLYAVPISNHQGSRQGVTGG